MLGVAHSLSSSSLCSYTICAQQRKGRTFITKGDAALCTRYGGSNTDAFFSLFLVPSLFLREKSEEVKKAPDGRKNVKNNYQMEPLIENLVIFGIVGAIRTTQWLYSTHEERINREVEHIRMYLKRCGDKMKGLKGFDLSFEEVLGDVSTANKCLESDGLRNLLDNKKFRLRVTPVFRGNGNVFVKLLKYNSSFAYAFGNVEFDFEVVKRRKDKEEKEEEKREWEKREEGGFVRSVAATREGESDVDDDDVDGNEEFEHVHVVRRCSIETFYRVVVPALRQISEKYENRENEETRRLLEVEDVTTTRTDRGVTGEECSICLDASLEVIARCGHGFCQECYARWLRRSGTCALCRERLPTTDHGGAFSLVSFSEICTEVPLSASFSQTNHRGDAEDEEEEPEEETLENFQICFGNEASLEWLKHRLSTFDVVCEQDVSAFRKFKQTLFINKR